MGDPDSGSEAALQVGLMLEAAHSQSDPTGYEWVSEPLRNRYLTRNEAEWLVARVQDEMRAGGDADAGHRLGDLASTLAYAEVELALPPLLQVLSENRSSASASDLRNVMASLERVLWGADLASPFVVAQIRAYPQLREWLRQIALRHLNATGVRAEEQLPGLIAIVDGYVATVLAPPELREIRRSTFAVRNGVRGWPELVRGILRGAHEPIDRSLIAYAWHEPEDQEIVFVLAPDETLYRLEINVDDEGTLTRAFGYGLISPSGPSTSPRSKPSNESASSSRTSATTSATSPDAPRADPPTLPLSSSD